MTAIDSLSVVISNESINDEYNHMVVKVSKETSTVLPGQFFNLSCPQTESDKPFFRRPMSTYFADPVTGQIEFLYKVVGTGTRTLAELKSGDILPILGPLGRGFTLKDNYKHILIVGRGVGLATLAPLAESANEKKIKVTAILSARDHAHLMSQHRFNNCNATVIEIVDSDNSSSLENLASIVANIHSKDPFNALFTCGSSRITKFLQQFVIENDIDGEVALEQQMACGLGMCHCCVRPFRADASDPKLRSKRVCVDGPVFDIQEFVA